MVINGFTIDSVARPNDVIQAVRMLPGNRDTKWVRVVFDNVEPDQYVKILKLIKPECTIMGELCDSFDMKSYSIGDFFDRTRSYIRTLLTLVDVWEVGNEINGDWNGNPKDVAAKVAFAHDSVKAHDGKTAITMHTDYTNYINQPDFVKWLHDNLSPAILNATDYAFMSYYEEENSFKTLNWNQTADALGKLFPKALLGRGESGTKIKAHKLDEMKAAYGLKTTNARWIGGNFWWYFYEDCVPIKGSLWQNMYDAIKAQKP